MEKDGIVERDSVEVPIFYSQSLQPNAMLTNVIKFFQSENEPNNQVMNLINRYFVYYINNLTFIYLFA